MNKQLKPLLIIINSLLLILSMVLIFIEFVYKFFSIRAYSILVSVIIASLTAIIFAVVSAQLLIIRLYKGSKVTGWLLKFIFYFMKAATPVFLHLSKILGFDRNAVRRLFVDVNNRVVKAESLKFNNEDVIILVPHCLQYSECGIKLTSHSDNCKRCGRCCIGEILDIAALYKVPVFVMSGGTAARNTIAQKKPKLIISVACERDLTSGIMDVGNIPVIGIENERPNGACLNTNVNVDKINKTLEKMIDKSNLHRQSGGYHLK